MNDKNSTNPLDSKKKATDIITLRDLLAEQHVFRIPDYQRGYAWHNEFIVLWQIFYACIEPAIVNTIQVCLLWKRSLPIV